MPDYLNYAIFAGWLILAIVLIFVLKIFRAAPLARAPARAGSLSMVHVVAAFLFYCGVVAVAQVALFLIHPPPPPTPPPTTSWFFPSSAQTAYWLAKDIFDAQVQIVSSFAGLIPVGLLLLIAQANFRGGIREWGLDPKKIPRSIGVGLLGFVIIVPILEVFGIGSNWLVHYFEPQKPPSLHPVLQMMENLSLPSFYKIGLIITAAVLAPVCEELFFRGFVQTALRQPFHVMFSLQKPSAVAIAPSVARRWTAIVITSLFFACVHYRADQMNFEELPLLFLLAVALGYTYERTGSLWACITLHATFNAYNLAVASGN